MRKVLSFVLVLTLVLGSFSMAFAASEAQASLSDIAGNANEEAITVNFNLGIIDGMGDGTFAPDAAVTRAQFAAMITRALAIPDSALAGYTVTSFKDTAGYGWAVPYLAFCQSKGILVGDGAGNVMPGKTVSVNEAMAMVLRAVGYTNNSAALVGVWPANYVSLAQNNGLYDDVATAVGVTRANAAQIIYNALTVDKVEVAADGTTKVLTDKSMLTTGLGCDYDWKVIVGNEDTLINLKPFVGKYVKYYFDAKNKPYPIVAIAAEESDALTGKMTDDFNVTRSGISTEGAFIDKTGSATGFKLDVDDVKYTVTDGTYVDILFINGEKQDLSQNAGVAFTSDQTITINGNVVGKEIRSINSLSFWKIDNAKKVSKADLNQLNEQRLLGYDFTTLKDGSIDPNSFVLKGVTSLDKIAADNIVYVYVANNEITKVEVGTDVITGSVSKIKGKEFTVDGKVYKFATNSKATSDRPAVGDDVVLYLDAAGKIFTFDNKTGSNDKYAVLLSTTAVKSEYNFYTADDENEWIEVKTDAKPAMTPAGTIIGYTLNKDGAISSATNGGVYTENATLASITLLNTATGQYSVKSNAVVFTSKAGTGVNGVTSIGNVDTAKSLGSVIYKLNSKNQVVAMIVTDTLANKSAEDVYAVVDGISSVLNADGDKVLQLTGYANGAALDKMTDDNYAGWAVNAAAVELWKIDIKSDGTIKAKAVVGTSAGGAGVTVTAIANDGATLTLSAGGKVSLAKDPIVYRAVIKDGEIDSYALSDASAINEGNEVYIYNTEDEDDSPGYEVVIYVTKW